MSSVLPGPVFQRSVVLEPARHWECPKCSFTDVTHEARPHSRFHVCAGLKGLTAPMVPAGTRVKVTVHEREDYVAGEEVQTDEEGRPVMSVTIEREDGSNDTTVYAPRASAKVRTSI